mmetsp:Transcript_104409/g.164865  ORF Transcript_104409/g.164865 Transcript_104409/m.164865 type:complete len:423 (+) Transcript_104409:43-1311(+)
MTDAEKDDLGPSKVPPKKLQDRLEKKLSISLNREEIHVSRRCDFFGGDLRKTSSASSSTPKRKPPRRIQEIRDFDARYMLGKEVMPSTHRCMTVNFAQRKSDGLECVIKVRNKPGCFKSKADERTWRRSTEYLLNLPASGNLAQVYEVLEDANNLYIVMEKVRGMDLFETIAQEYVSVETSREIVRQLLRAMAHLHAHSALHKDIKLENVMIDESPKYSRRPSLTPTSVKVVDFDTIDQWTPSSPAGRDVVGTDQYIAQEAYAGKYSPLSDIFAVGVIAFKLVSGRFPFHEQIFDDEEGENWVGSPKMDEIRQRLKTTRIDFSHSVFQKYPKANDLIQKMLSHDENARPTAAAALNHAWFLEDEDSTPGKNQEPLKASVPETQEEVAMVRTRSALPNGYDHTDGVAEEATVGEARSQILLRA